MFCSERSHRLKGYSTCGLLNYKEKKVSNEEKWLKSREQNYGWKKSNCNFCLIVHGEGCKALQ
jgi:hypothetical protein